MNEEMLASIVAAISNVGFPIFLSVYLLDKIDVKIESMVTAINELTIAIRSQDNG